MSTMNTQIAIVNSALLKLGDARISSITQQTKSAIHANAIWDQIRDCVLRAHPWHFAKKRTRLYPAAARPPIEGGYSIYSPPWVPQIENQVEPTIPPQPQFPSAGAPVWGYRFSYTLPADWIRPLETRGPDLSAFVIENSQLLSDCEMLDIAYIYRNVDPSTWDACFCEAMAWRLANEMAYNLTANIQLIQATLAGYKLQLAEARAMNGMEDNNFPALEATTWTDARKGFRYGLVGPVEG